MSNAEKAIIYEECLRASDILQREISKLKSEHTGNITPEVQREINIRQDKVQFYVRKLESLFD